MSSVFLLTRERADTDHIKIVGIYTTADLAERARDRLQSKPGFHDDPAGFAITVHSLDPDSWAEGFPDSDDRLTDA